MPRVVVETAIDAFWPGLDDLDGYTSILVPSSAGEEFGALSSDSPEDSISSGMFFILSTNFSSVDSTEQVAIKAMPLSLLPLSPFGSSEVSSRLAPFFETEAVIVSCVLALFLVALLFFAYHYMDMMDFGGGKLAWVLADVCQEDQLRPSSSEATRTLPPAAASNKHDTSINQVNQSKQSSTERHYDNATGMSAPPRPTGTGTCSPSSKSVSDPAAQITVNVHFRSSISLDSASGSGEKLMKTPSSSSSEKGGMPEMRGSDATETDSSCRDEDSAAASVSPAADNLASSSESYVNDFARAAARGLLLPQISSKGNSCWKVEKLPAQGAKGGTNFSISGNPFFTHTIRASTVAASLKPSSFETSAKEQKGEQDLEEETHQEYIESYRHQMHNWQRLQSKSKPAKRD